MTTFTLEREALEAMPIFPLPDVVFFPGTLLPLHVFEPRYRKMLADCMESHRAMVVVRIRPGARSGPNGPAPAIEAIAGAGVVIRHEALPDGRSNILLAGLARVALDELPFVAPYRRARCTVLSPIESPLSELDRASLATAATSFARAVKRRDPSFDVALPEDRGAPGLADVCAAHLLASADARQRALEELDEAKRVRFVTRELAVQEASLRRNGADESDERGERGEREKRTLH